METQGQRIKRLREKLGLTLEEVGKEIGLTKQAIYKYENDIVTNIPYDKILLLSKALQVEPWEILGWGGPSAKIFKPSSWSFEIPFISQKLSAGPGKDWISDEDLEIKTINLADDLPRGVDPSTLVCAEVQGDSMEGAHLYSGDVVIFSKGFISGDGIYVLALCGDVLVKRLQYAPWENKVYIISENQKYPTQSVEADNENLVVLGKVLKWFHFEH